MREWFAPQAAAELLHFRSLIDDYEHADVLRVVLARAARSARLTTHFDLDFPRTPQREPYWCHKHRRTCAPVQEAAKFLSRYLLDTLERIKEFQRVRARGRAAPTSSTATRPTSRSRGRSTRSSPRRPTRGSSTTTSSIGTRTSCSSSTTAASASSEQPRAARAARDRGATSPASRGARRPARRARAGRARDRRRERSPRPVSARFSSGAASGSSTASSATSTVGPGGARASTSSRSWSVYGKRKVRGRDRVGRRPG